MLTALVAAFAMLLTGCAGPGMTRTPRLDDPALEQHVRDLVCRLTNSCAEIRMMLVDSPQAQAELLPDGTLALRIGLLLAVEEEGELVFVLAHEIAHRRLGHSPPISLAERLPLELAADAEALRMTRALGYPEDSGHRLISRLEPGADSDAMDEAARHQIAERLRALPLSQPRASVTDPRWLGLITRYRLAPGR